MKIAVIGGGASGMMAAIAAARKGREVVIFEKNEKLGKKILITGNGRCNITNRNVSWQNYHGEHPKFAASVFSKFSNEDAIKFFEDLGLVLVEEDRGRLFPRSNQAQSVIDVLEHEIDRLDVQVIFNQKIKSILKENKQFLITTYQKKQHTFDKLIIATGGKSYPKTGSTGDGFRFAESFGHRVVDPFPSSVPFRIKSQVCNKLQGIKVDAELRILFKGKKIAESTDELLFTHLGLSAPAVLETSREVSYLLVKHKKTKVICSINFFPEYSQEELRNMLHDRFEKNPDKKIGNQFIGLLPKKLAPTVFKYKNLDPELISQNSSKKTINRIVNLLTDYQETITGTLGWNQAQFTAGGVDTKEIDSKTMQSKLIDGLYFCGEVVDIDGDSGGYNLQWAWSSGHLAGNSI